MLTLLQVNANSYFRGHRSALLEPSWYLYNDRYTYRYVKIYQVYVEARNRFVCVLEFNAVSESLSKSWCIGVYHYCYHYQIDCGDGSCNRKLVQILLHYASKHLLIHVLYFN